MKDENVTHASTTSIIATKNWNKFWKGWISLIRRLAFLESAYEISSEKAITYDRECPAGKPYAYADGRFCCDTFEFDLPLGHKNRHYVGHIGRSFGHCKGDYWPCNTKQRCSDYQQITDGKDTAMKTGKNITKSFTLTQGIVFSCGRWDWSKKIAGSKVRGLSFFYRVNGHLFFSHWKKNLKSVGFAIKVSLWNPFVILEEWWV